MIDQTVFVTLISSTKQIFSTKLLIDSIHTFAGPMRNQPIWVFTINIQEQIPDQLKDLGVEIIPLNVPDSIRSYWFAGKVYACARAEELASPKIKSIIWISSDCLVIQSPVLFELGASYNAAFRPVHIRNVGLLASEPLDAYWKHIYQTIGVDDVPITVESFVDHQRLRAYYNSHAFAIDPAHGLMHTWYETFEKLVGDEEFQHSTCSDELQQVFLHQALLSTLIAARIHPDRIYNLPPTYTYPYNLQGKVPADRQASTLNDLVCIAYENRSLHPGDVKDIRIAEPLRSWLAERYNR